jgi:protein TonB
VTTLAASAEHRPMVIGVAAAFCFHALVVTVFALVYLDVSPMTTPPLEVELMGGFAPSDVPAAPTDEAASVPEPRLPATRAEPIPAAVPEPESEEPVPDLPEAVSGTAEPLSPPRISSVPPREIRSPSQRLSPLPVSPPDTTAAEESRVHVRVEGMLRARRLVHMVDPLFPREAHGGGSVKVRLAVDQDGTVTLATVTQKAHPALERAALQALKQWRFAPSNTGAVSDGIVTVDFVVQ